MADESSKGYRLEIPDDVLDEALEVVQKPKRKSHEDTEVVVEIEEESPGQEPATAPEALLQELQAAKEAAAAAKDRMMRVAADADNVRKRAIREKQEAIRFGSENLFRDLLPIVDNLERTIRHIPADIDDEVTKALAEGVRMILLQFSETLRRHDVVGFDSVGEKFDPSRHEALSSKPCDTADPGTVLSEMHRGYKLHERLLRPALVEVACAPKNPEPPEADARADACEPGQDRKEAPEEDTAKAQPEENPEGKDQQD